jgi:hypothetical protein
MTPFSETRFVEIGRPQQAPGTLSAFAQPNAIPQGIRQPLTPRVRCSVDLWMHSHKRLKLPDNVRSQAAESKSPATKH